MTDPSNASFMGVYDTLGLTGWRDELLAATGLSRSQMPEVVDAGELAGAADDEWGRISWGCRPGCRCLRA